MIAAICAGLAVSILSLSLVAPVTGGSFEDAGAAFKRGDYATAIQLVRPLAEQGFPPAQAILGIMYDSGSGVPQDYTEALKWFRKAAEQGHAHAQTMLGLMYFLGRAAPRDYVQAHKWLNLAAARYPASETENRENAVSARERVASKMTAAQIAEAQRLAREWKPK